MVKHLFLLLIKLIKLSYIFYKSQSKNVESTNIKSDSLVVT